MFPYHGIMASEEPKEPNSVSGLYNSSKFTGGNLSQGLFSNKSEFSYMFWAYVDSLTGTLFVSPYREQTTVGLSTITLATDFDEIYISLKNSNGGTTSLTTSTLIDRQKWFHVCVTGSVLNNRVRAYYNGVLQGSAVMTYANAVSTSNDILNNSSAISFSQFNTYDRELTEAEVLEHYVYDEDTMTSGVLGFDAMTPAQKSGLFYSASYTENISRAGNEFTDKSGNNITVSPQPLLTGEQIYVYTDANDLPSDTTIYPVNSAALNGTSQYFNAGNDPALQQTTSTGFSIWVKPISLGNSFVIASKAQYTVPVQYSWDIEITPANKYKINIGDATGFYGAVILESTTLASTTKYDLVAWEYDGATISLVINGAVEASAPYTVPLYNTSVPLLIGTYGGVNEGELKFTGSLAMPILLSSSPTLAERTELYNAIEKPKCFEDMSTALKNKIVYTPRLSNWDTNAGQELIDQSGNGVVTTAIGSPTYTGTGLSIEC